MADNSHMTKRSLRPLWNFLPDLRRRHSGVETPPQHDSVTSDIGSYIQYNRTVGGDNDHISEDFYPDHVENATSSETEPAHVPPVRPARAHASSRGYRPSLPSVPSVTTLDVSAMSNRIGTTKPSSSCFSAAAAAAGAYAMYMTDMEYYNQMPEMVGRYPRMSTKIHFRPDASSCGCHRSDTTNGTSYCSTSASYADRHTGFLPASLDVPHVVPVTERFALDDIGIDSQFNLPPATPYPSPQLSSTQPSSSQTTSFCGSDGANDDPKPAVEDMENPKESTDDTWHNFLQSILHGSCFARFATAETATETKTKTTAPLDAKALTSTSRIFFDDTDYDLTYFQKEDPDLEKQMVAELIEKRRSRKAVLAILFVLLITLLMTGVSVTVYCTTTKNGRV